MHHMLIIVSRETEARSLIYCVDRWRCLWEAAR